MAKKEFRCLHNFPFCQGFFCSLVPKRRTNNFIKSAFFIGQDLNTESDEEILKVEDSEQTICKQRLNSLWRLDVFSYIITCKFLEVNLILKTNKFPFLT